MSMGTAPQGRRHHLERCLLALLLVGGGCIAESPTEVTDDQLASKPEMVVLERLPSRRAGGGSTGCKNDRSVELPARIASVQVQSPMRLHITGQAGSDNGLSVYPKWYEIRDDAGTVTYAPSGIYVGDPALLLQMTAEGLRAGAHYRITARSTDGCGNVAYSTPIDVTMPAPRAETVPPPVQGPTYR